MAIITKSTKSIESSKKHTSAVQLNKKISSSNATKEIKLGDASLGWISDTAPSKAANVEAASSQRTDENPLKELKLAVVKEFDKGKSGKERDVAAESRPGLTSGSSTITKGTKAAGEDKKEIKVEEVTKSLGEENLAVVPEGPVKGLEAKESFVAEKKKEVAATVVKAAVAVKKKKEVAENKSAGTAGPVKDNAKGKSPHIPDDLSTIVKKAAAPSGKAKKEMPASVAAFRDNLAEPVRKGWSKVVDLGKPINNGSWKALRNVAKQFSNSQLKETASSVINAAKQPVNTLATMDRGITRSMKNIVFIGNYGSTGQSLINNIKATDVKFTKSARKVIDSIL